MKEIDKDFIIAVKEKFDVDLIYTDRFIFPKGIDSDLVILIFNFYREHFV